jgi:hypothetical protein
VRGLARTVWWPHPVSRLYSRGTGRSRQLSRIFRSSLLAEFAVNGSTVSPWAAIQTVCTKSERGQPTSAHAAGRAVAGNDLAHVGDGGDCLPFPGGPARRGADATLVVTPAGGTVGDITGRNKRRQR